MNRIEDIEKAIYPHEKTLYYCFAFSSFLAVLQIVIPLYLFLNNNKLKNPRVGILVIVNGLAMCIMFGFTTSLPFFL